MHDQQSFFNRLNDLADQAGRQGRMTATSFLTPAEQSVADPYLRNRQIPFCLAGGYALAERARCLFWANAEESPDVASMLAASEIIPSQSGSGHRDYLGSLLSLGIRRDQLGDIIVLSDRAYVIHMPELSRFFPSQLDRIGTLPARCQAADLSVLTDLVPKSAIEQTTTVSSLRTDVVLGAVFHCSRSQSQELIRRGKVLVDWRECLKPDQLLTTGQTLTVRGLGRTRLLNCEGKSRKGRIRLVYERYA